MVTYLAAPCMEYPMRVGPTPVLQVINGQLFVHLKSSLQLETTERLLKGSVNVLETADSSLGLHDLGPSVNVSLVEILVDPIR